MDEGTIRGIVIGIIGLVILRSYLNSLAEPFEQVPDGESIEDWNDNYFKTSLKSRMSKPGLMLVLFAVGLIIAGVGAIILT